MKTEIGCFEEWQEMRPKLIGSDSIFERLLDRVKEYFGGTEIKLVYRSTGVIQLENSNGEIKGFQIRKLRNRYRFEFIGGAE